MTQSHFLPFPNFSWWHSIALVCLFREDSSACLLKQSWDCVWHKSRKGQKKWNVWTCLPVLTWRDYLYSENNHIQTVHSSSVFTVQRLSSGVPAHSSCVMCHLFVRNWVYQVILCSPGLQTMFVENIVQHLYPGSNLNRQPIVKHFLSHCLSPWSQTRLLQVPLVHSVFRTIFYSYSGWI